MTAMQEVVEDALEELGVKTTEIPLTDDELQSGLRRVNDMLSEWSYIGLTPGYNPVLYATDELEVPRNAISAIKYNAAIRLAPSYQRPVAPALANIAAETMSALEASSIYIGEVDYPDTLPLGSGNECGDYYESRFFNSNKEENF